MVDERGRLISQTTLDNITNTRYLQYLFCFILFVDTFLAFFTGKGLLHLIYNIGQAVPFGAILVSVFLFGLTTTIIVPRLRYLVDWIIFSIPGNFYKLFIARNNDYRNPELIDIKLMQEKAVKDNQSVPYQHSQMLYAELDKIWVEQNLYFFSFLLIFLNVFVVENTLIRQLFQYLPQYQSVLTTSTIILMLTFLWLSLKEILLGNKFYVPDMREYNQEKNNTSVRKVMPNSLEDKQLPVPTNDSYEEFKTNSNKEKVLTERR
jgi:hypothetical protein